MSADFDGQRIRPGVKKSILRHSPSAVRLLVEQMLWTFAFEGVEDVLGGEASHAVARVR